MPAKAKSVKPQPKSQSTPPPGLSEIRLITNAALVLATAHEKNNKITEAIIMYNAIIRNYNGIPEVDLASEDKDKIATCNARIKVLQNIPPVIVKVIDQAKRTGLKIIHIAGSEVNEWIGQLRAPQPPPPTKKMKCENKFGVVASVVPSTAASAAQCSEPADCKTAAAKAHDTIHSLRRSIGRCYIEITKKFAVIKGAIEKNKDKKLMAASGCVLESAAKHNTTALTSTDEKQLIALLNKIQKQVQQMDQFQIHVISKAAKQSKPVKPKKSVSSGSELPPAASFSHPDTAAAAAVGSGQPAAVKAVTQFFAPPPSPVVAERPVPTATAAPAIVTVLAATTAVASPTVVDSKHNVMTAVVLSPPPSVDVKHAVMTAGVTDKEKIKREINKCFQEIIDLIGIKVVGEEFFADDSKGFAKYYGEDYGDKLSFTLEFIVFNQQCLIPYTDSQKATASLDQLKTILSNFENKKNDLLRIQGEMLNSVLPTVKETVVRNSLQLKY